jgi:hypothetical protein
MYIDIINSKNDKAKEVVFNLVEREKKERSIVEND